MEKATFIDTGGWAAAFRHWGYPDWFRVMIGVLELAGVVLLTLGRTAAFGCACSGALPQRRGGAP